MPLYRKKPVIIEAIQWTGDNVAECSTFTGQTFFTPDAGKDVGLYVAANSAIVPLPIGQWIMKDRLGFYPCDPTIFAETYEAVVPLIDTSTFDEPHRVSCARCGQDIGLYRPGAGQSLLTEHLPSCPHNVSPRD